MFFREQGDGNDTMVEPAVVRWWVYEGRRQRISSPVEDSGVGEWVDCTECECDINVNLPLAPRFAVCISIHPSLLIA